MFIQNTSHNLIFSVWLVIEDQFFDSFYFCWAFKAYYFIYCLLSLFNIIFHVIKKILLVRFFFKISNNGSCIIVEKTSIYLKNIYVRQICY